MVPGWRTIVYRVGWWTKHVRPRHQRRRSVPRRLTTGPFIDKRAPFPGWEIDLLPLKPERDVEIWRYLPVAEPRSDHPGRRRSRVSTGIARREIPLLREGISDAMQHLENAVRGGEETIVLDSVHCTGGWRSGKMGSTSSDQRTRRDTATYTNMSSLLARRARFSRSRSRLLSHRGFPDGRSILYTKTIKTAAT